MWTGNEIKEYEARRVHDALMLHSVVTSAATNKQLLEAIIKKLKVCKG
jgi:hypothetical protein